jgi:ABC-type antimicrobial peptide transport system permease subunit
MTRKRRPLAALVLVSVIAVIGAGCGSNTPTGTAKGSGDSGSSAGTANSGGTGGNTTKHWATVIPTEAGAGGLASSLLIGAVAGLIPALRAARLSPTQALWSV